MNTSHYPDLPPAGRGYWHSLLMASLLAFVMLGITGAYWKNERDQTEQAHRYAINHEADQIAQSIRDRLNAYEVMLRGVKGYYEGSDTITVAEFRAYVQALQLSTSATGLQGVALVRYVPHAEKAALVTHMQAMGAPHYALKPPGLRDFYAPITHIEPATADNLKVVGFDVSTVPPAAEAMARARDTGHLAMTRRLMLAQDAGKAASASFVMFLPLADRAPQVGLAGWVDVPFRMRDLMQGLFGSTDTDFQIRIYEGEALQADALLFVSGNERLSSAPQGDVTLMSVTRSLDFGGRRWTLALQETPALLARSYQGDYLIITSLGVLLSFFMGGMAWFLLTGRARAVALARDMTAELRDMTRNLDATLNAIPDLLFELDLNGRYHRYHSPRTDLLAAPPEMLIGQSVSDILPQDAAQTCMVALQEAHAIGYSVGKQIELQLGPDKKWFELSVARKEHASGEGPRFIMLSRDITDRKHDEERLRDAAEQTQSILDNMVDGVITISAGGLMESFNQAAACMFGYAPSEVLGRNVSVLMPAPHLDQHDTYLAHHQSKGALHELVKVREVQGLRQDGSLFPMSLSVSKITRAGQTTFIGLVRDLTQRHHDEDEIRRLAYYDSLTGLPNRRLLIDRLKHAVETSARSGQHGALMFLDLDNFKDINDTLGHGVGDELLRQVGQRLQGCLREGDSLARLGGDDFGLLLENLGTQAQEAAAHCEVIGKKILDALRQPYSLSGHLYTSTPSVGIVVFQHDQASVDDLFKKADIAMYQAKAAGRNTARFFDFNLQVAAMARAALEEDLRRGLASGEFLLHYQIQVNGNAMPVGVEALVRWQHGQRGLVSPAHFIPLAEETGLILPLGQWVLETACAQLVEWAKNPVTQDWTMAVNVSALQFGQPDFVAHVTHALQKTGGNPARLKLELTESMLATNVDEIIVKMNALMSLGVRFSLDDFGTGYSSLSYLKRLPLAQLKIDQSFVRDLLTDPNDAAIARTIVALGHSLGLMVIAEGVETAGQRDFLASIGCDAYQGYYFGRPLAHQDLEGLWACEADRENHGAT